MKSRHENILRGCEAHPPWHQAPSLHLRGCVIAPGHSDFTSVWQELVCSPRVSDSHGRALPRVHCFSHVLFSVVSAGPWADAFPSDSPVYHPDATTERNGARGQHHGVCAEGFPLAPRPAHHRHGRVCEGAVLWLEGAVVSSHFVPLLQHACDWPASPVSWWECVMLCLLKYLLFCTALSQNEHLGSFRLAWKSDETFLLFVGNWLESIFNPLVMVGLVSLRQVLV